MPKKVAINLMADGLILMFSKNYWMTTQQSFKILKNVIF